MPLHNRMMTQKTDHFLLVEESQWLSPHPAGLARARSKPIVHSKLDSAGPVVLVVVLVLWRAVLYFVVVFWFVTLTF